MKYSICPSCQNTQLASDTVCVKCNSHLLHYGNRECTLYVKYGDLNLSVSDFAVEDTYNLLVENCERQFADPNKPSTYYAGFSTENIFNRLRLGVVNKEFTFKVVFLYYQFDLEVNRFGAVPSTIEGFLDYNVTIANKILHKAMELRKEEKKTKRYPVETVGKVIHLIFPNSDIWGTGAEVIEYVSMYEPIFRLGSFIYKMHYSEADGFYYNFVGNYDGV